MLLSASMITSTAKASLTCDQVLQLCDDALKDERSLTEKQGNMIKAQDDVIRLQRTKIDDLTTENKSILRSPYLWGVLGFVGGVLLVK